MLTRRRVSRTQAAPSGGENIVRMSFDHFKYAKNDGAICVNNHKGNYKTGNEPDV